MERNGEPCVIISKVNTFGSSTRHLNLIATERKLQENKDTSYHTLTTEKKKLYSCFFWLCYEVIVYSYFEKGCRKKVHATILKGIVGDFKCTVFQGNLKELYGRRLIYVCEC